MSAEDISHIMEELGSIKTKQATMETKQDSMLESLNQMKAGIGQRVETQGIQVAVLTDRMEAVTRIIWGVASVFGLGILGALVKLVLVK